MEAPCALGTVLVTDVAFRKTDLEVSSASGAFRHERASVEC